ncbi:MAG: tripartite tricarboxylate transporter substrate-binding protein, partial [Chthoniobacterales bacterium]
MSAALPWYVLLLPLVSAAAILLFLRRSSGISAFVSVGSSIIGFICACLVFRSSEPGTIDFSWIDLRPLFYVPLGLTLDPLSKMMLLLVTAINTWNASLYEKLNFDFIRDIAPVAGLNRQTFVMMVTPSFPAKTVPEFIAYVKANPDKINV